MDDTTFHSDSETKGEWNKQTTNQTTKKKQKNKRADQIFKYRNPSNQFSSTKFLILHSPELIKSPQPISRHHFLLL
jgi:exopolysaccharide biosynthesis protein